MPSLYLNIGFAAYFLSLICYSLILFFKNKVLSFFAKAGGICGIISLTIYILTRWVIGAQPPLTNMFESLIVFSWAVGFGFVFVDLKYKIKPVAMLVSLLGLLALGYASLLNQELMPLLPALKSNWLTIHVLSCFIGYAGLTVAFAAGLMFLFQASKKKPANLSLLDQISYKMIAFGFLFLTLGIISGSIWANSAWGTYWSWDPKETWSLITWLIYAIYLHVRIRRGWKGKRVAWLSIVGFLAMLFTYFGVNYLLSGLHTYV